VVRKLTQADAAAFREIHLKALRLAPEAFGITFERESAFAIEQFAQRLVTSECVGAFRDDALIGIAALHVLAGKCSHKGALVAMYVVPAARRSGVGRRLVEAIIDIARERVEIVQLGVVTENEAAIRLYASQGFLVYGIEKKALKQEGRYYDELLMALDLSELSR
jgi:ribosomal protein S18 acetylase RimI-like enzyme